MIIITFAASKSTSATGCIMVFNGFISALSQGGRD